MKIIHQAAEPQPFLSAGESMGAGNTTAGHNEIAFSGPGSPSIIPPVEVLDQLAPDPGPVRDMVPDIHDNQQRVEGHPDASASMWHDPGYIDEGSTDRWGWRET